MSKQECWKELQIVMQAFGSEKFPTADLGKIWEASQKLPLKAFQDITKDFMLRRNLNDPPKLKDFQDAVKAYFRATKPNPELTRNPDVQYKFNPRPLIEDFLKKAGTGAFKKPC